MGIGGFNVGIVALTLGIILCFNPIEWEKVILTKSEGGRMLILHGPSFNPIEWGKVILTATGCTWYIDYTIQTASCGGYKVPNGNLWG